MVLSLSMGMVFGVIWTAGPLAAGGSSMEQRTGSFTVTASAQGWDSSCLAAVSDPVMNRVGASTDEMNRGSPPRCGRGVAAALPSRAPPRCRRLMPAALAQRR